MKKTVSVLLLALALSSCAVKTVSRTELFTPTTATLVNSQELTDMKYYGSDNEYDYFSRGFQRLRVAKSENSIPNACRFTFDNWVTSKKYTDCVKDTATSKLQNIISGLTTGTTAPTTTTTTTSTARQQQVQAVQTLLQGFSKKQ